jgi:hypothetical protein
MNWQCRICDRIEGQETDDGDTVKIIATCHHCGQLLCQKHARSITDEVFALNEDRIREKLPEWYQALIQLEISQKFRALEIKFLLFLANYCPDYKHLRQKAYHCESCLKKYHPRAKSKID